jgi:hypothetical protein
MRSKTIAERLRCVACVVSRAISLQRVSGGAREIMGARHLVRPLQQPSRSQRSRWEVAMKASASLESIRPILLSESSRFTPTLGRVLSVGFLAALALILSSCAVVGDIFKAGVWVGVLGVVCLFVLVGGLATLFSR